MTSFWSVDRHAFQRFKHFYRTSSTVNNWTYRSIQMRPLHTVQFKWLFWRATKTAKSKTYFWCYFIIITNQLKWTINFWKLPKIKMFIHKCKMSSPWISALFWSQYSMNAFQVLSNRKVYASPTTISRHLALVITTLNRWKWVMEMIIERSSYSLKRLIPAGYWRSRQLYHWCEPSILSSLVSHDPETTV